MTESVPGYAFDLLDDEIGHGGFGTVYKGLDRDRKTVAIKRLSKEHKANASTEAMKSYFIKNNINHNQIVKIYDVKFWKNSMWIIMEYCELGDLDKFFKCHTAAVKDLLPKVKLMKQISNAVQFLHSQDIVHRDIKPANILVKLAPERQALIKLGDFGLSRFLKPDSLTSAMSTKAGTDMYKAPELWNIIPGQPVKYHRNIDVYSTGLTFAAMLQARPDHSLVPRAEGSVRPSEMSTPIGLAAHNRMNYQQAVFNVVENKKGDDQMTKSVKSLIQDMTQVSPQKRASSSIANEQLNAILKVCLIRKVLMCKTTFCVISIHVLERGLFCTSPNLCSLFFQDERIVTIRCFVLEQSYLPDSSVMSDVNRNLVIRGRSFRRDKHFEFNFCERMKGRIFHTMVSACDHWLLQGCLATCCSQDDDEYLVEACPECRNIRIYDSWVLVNEFAFENVRHSCICSGPDGTIFVWGHMKLLNLRLDGTRFRLLSTSRWLLNGGKEVPMAKEVASMCYAEGCNTIVFLANCNDGYNHLFGILWPKHSSKILRVVWEYCGSVNGIPLDPFDVCSTPCGNVCIANTTNVLLLDPKDGSLITILLEEALLSNVSEVVCHWDEDDEIRVAVRHGVGKPTETSCYNYKYFSKKYDEFSVPITELRPDADNSTC